MIFESFASKEKIKQNPRKSSTNHQKIIVLLEKPRKLAKILDFHGFSSKTMIFGYFFDDFLMIFEGFASKEKIKQNLGNHQKIIKKSSFCLKKPENLPKSWFFKVFPAKR